MLTVFVFDERESGREEDMRAALDRLADDALLWIALLDPSEEEVAAVQEALELSDEQAERLLEQPSRPSLIDAGDARHRRLRTLGRPQPTLDLVASPSHSSNTRAVKRAFVAIEEGDDARLVYRSMRRVSPSSGVRCVRNPFANSYNTTG
jgi:Mg2+ and Co2+ transporter CorA